ncbi:hypothetical protein OROMI_010115 [Orobanche minor]
MDSQLSSMEIPNVSLAKSGSSKTHKHYESNYKSKFTQKTSKKFEGNCNNSEKSLINSMSNLNLCAIVFEASLVDNSREYFVDTCATCYICSDREAFSNYIPMLDRTFHMGNLLAINVAGVGRMVLRWTFGMEPTLMVVLYVPNIKKDLTSGPY